MRKQRERDIRWQKNAYSKRKGWGKRGSKGGWQGGREGKRDSE